MTLLVSEVSNFDADLLKFEIVRFVDSIPKAGIGVSPFLSVIFFLTFRK